MQGLFYVLSRAVYCNSLPVRKNILLEPKGLRLDISDRFRCLRAPRLCFFASANRPSGLVDNRSCFSERVGVFFVLVTPTPQHYSALPSFSEKMVMLITRGLTLLAVLLAACQSYAPRPQPPEALQRTQTESRVTPTPPVLPPPAAGVSSNLSTAQAQQHIGETNTVCGFVASVRFLESAKGRPTFLNFDNPFPNHTFSVVIFESSRGKFASPPEELFNHKTVCVTGGIMDYRGKPEIIVEDPSQIVLQEAIPASESGTETNLDQNAPGTISETTTNRDQKEPTNGD
jgi:hypothetical protein